MTPDQWEAMFCLMLFVAMEGWWCAVWALWHLRRAEIAYSELWKAYDELRTKSLLPTMRREAERSQKYLDAMRESED